MSTVSQDVARPRVTGSGPARWIRPAVYLVVVLAVLVAMLRSTRFVDPAEEARLNPPAFNAATYATEKFPAVKAAITAEAVDIAEFARAADADPDAAGAKYGQGSNGVFAVPVRATGVVAAVQGTFALLTVPGMPAADKVRIPLAGLVINGTPIRDATTAITFGDVPSQTDYLTVANELSRIETQQVIAPARVPTLTGKRITVIGACSAGSSGGVPNSYPVQPVSIEIAS